MPEKDEFEVMAARLLAKLQQLEAALYDDAAPDPSLEQELRLKTIADFLREEFGPPKFKNLL